jgi:DNA-binding protein Fis
MLTATLYIVGQDGVYVCHASRRGKNKSAKRNLIEYWLKRTELVVWDLVHSMVQGNQFRASASFGVRRNCPV